MTQLLNVSHNPILDNETRRDKPRNDLIYTRWLYEQQRSQEKKRLEHRTMPKRGKMKKRIKDHKTSEFSTKLLVTPWQERSQDLQQPMLLEKSTWWDSVTKPPTAMPALDPWA